jgi:hypothetical protein
MSPEAKAALLKRLAEGRAKTKAARADAKAKNLPDPKPRKVRKDKKMAIPDPAAVPAARETIAPISGAPAHDKNKVSALPVDPSKNVTTPIDVPNLPSEKKLNDIVEDAAKEPEAADRKGVSTTGKPEKYDDNELIKNEETGNQVIEAQYPGQKESILKVLKANKKENNPLKPKPEPSPSEKTTMNVTSHVPDVKAVQGREPFSFSAIRKALYQ